MLSPFGGSSNNYNHQGMQAMVEDEILWVMENYNIDKNRIYMVGGSLGGATGSIYANNHLNPTLPMVAATASASGILDCERRAIEMDGNNSMIEWFGGEWHEVPFEYHRNSAVYFDDPVQSMHYNLQNTPLYLDFGVTEPHRTHAEDFYNLLDGYNENMWIDTDPAGSHGYSVFDENHVCEWLSQFELADNPDTINVNLDEPSRAYWIEAYNQHIPDEFIRINTSMEYWDGNSQNVVHSFTIHEYSNSDSLILHILDDQYIASINPNIFNFHINIPILGNLGFSGYMFNGDNLENVFTSHMDGSSCNLDEYNIDENNNIWFEINNIPCETIITFEFHQDTFDDINLDGIWNVIDIVLVINHILGISELYEFQLLNADINQDGVVNVLDVVLIVNMILDT